MGLQTGVVTLEIIMNNPQKAEIDLPFDLIKPLLDICLKDWASYSTSICSILLNTALFSIPKK